MPAQQAADIDEQRHPVGRGVRPAGVNVDAAGHVAGTTREQLLVVDPIEVDHALTGQAIEIDAVAADFTHLFHRGHDAFQRRMRNVG